MNEKWSLDALYTGLDSAKFKADWQELRELIAANRNLSDPATTVAAIKARLQVFSRLSVLANSLEGYLYLRTSADTSDIEAENLLEQIQTACNELKPAEVAFCRSIAAFTPWEDLITDPDLADLKYYLERKRAESKYLLSSEEEELAAGLNMAGGNAWSALFDQLTANLQMDFQGKKCTLADIRNYAYDSEASVREAAYRAELASYKEIAVPVSFALNSIKKQAKFMSRRRGFASPLDEAVFDSFMSRETLDALLGAIRERLPLFRRYLKAKAKYLGHSGALPWWDLFAPLGRTNHTYTLDEAKDLLVKAFNKLHPPIAELMRRAFDEAWIDFWPRPGKVGGAFCSNLPQIKQSRILTNFNGSFDAVDTLAHELGHAYHGYRIQNHLPLNWDYSMPVAETASTFNETHLTLMSLADTDDREEKLAILEGVLCNTCQTVVDIYSRFLFEEAVFDTCDRGRLTVEECCETMHKAQLEAYGEAIIPETLHPYMWACKGHYYSSYMGYYNFPYAFGALLAIGLYSRYQAEGAAFMPKYDQFLTMTTVASAEDTARSVGIDLTNQEFWLSGLDTFGTFVEQFEELVWKIY
ncbi:M3 family oligoendopeptidase [Mageeibacillus indolicus]|uniref:M3 family oligoendopeptidase n=1 Tax=Mageeibacillus indolicus TaxID=884684 RepID=UPI0004DD12C7|nr:M3 family oligoendopeptidase [Mageeibacillus indolicus]KFA56776.1 hypothetical protein HMPREF1632_07600 [Mageeibacillus indolicus 0009-5]